jgi:hypothetical protein
MKMDKKYVSYLVIIFLIFINVVLFNRITNMDKKFDNYESTIRALNDSIHVTVKNGFTNYTQMTPEINLKDLLNSEFYNTLSDDQKKFYKDLKEIKNLISATNAQMSKQGKLIDSLLKNPGVIENDSIRFKLGTVLEFNEKDTTKKLQWKSNILLDKQIKFNFDYDYNFNVLTTYERRKDKSIVVNYKIDDPELKITKMNNFIIPVEQKSKLGQFMDKNKKIIQISGGLVVFGAGAYIGYKYF